MSECTERGPAGPSGGPRSHQSEPVGSDSCCSLSQMLELGWEPSPAAAAPLPAYEKRVERCLKKHARAGDERAVFFLAQLYFESEDYRRARRLFSSIAMANVFARYQLGVMLFEGLGCPQDVKKGFRMMLAVALSVPKTPEQEEVIHKAQYNIARAYFMGFGVKSNENDGRRWLERATGGGSRRGSVRAQTMQAMLLARGDSFDLKSSFFWHSEATGNGSVESQGALGVMYLYGLGIRRDLVSARLCLSRAARRGNIYAAGQLCLHYYRSHFYRLAARFAEQLAQFGAADVASLARRSGCIPCYVRRGLAVACFVLHRCLQRGLGGLPRDPERAREAGARAAKLDGATVADLQALTMHAYWRDTPRESEVQGDPMPPGL